MKLHMSRWLPAVVVGFLLLCPHVKIYTVEATRYDTYWGRHDALAIAAAACLLGTVLFGVYELVRAANVRWLKRLADAVFLLTTGLALVACLHEGVVVDLGAWNQPLCLILTIAVAALAVLSLWDRAKSLPRTCFNICLIMSPAIPLVLGLLLSYPQFAVPGERFPTQTASPARPVAAGADKPENVYIFIFDEWSYQRTFEDQHAANEFPNLSALADTATCYHNAHSPHRSTSPSPPRTLFRTTDEYTYARGRLGFEDDRVGFVPVERHGNLFKSMKASNYHTYMVGWAHPYRRLLGDELDFCWSAPCREGGMANDSFVQTVTRQLRLGLSRSTLAIPKPAALQWRLERFWRTRSQEHPTDMLSTIHGLALGTIRQQTSPCFAVFHYPLPHWPFVYDRHGLKANASRDNPLEFATTRDGERSAPDPENYVARYSGNLRYLDTVIGELVEALQSTGKFDRAMLVLTSDHSWREDPRIDAEPESDVFTHVPLVIKFPHQHRPAAVIDEFLLTNLEHLIESADSAGYVERTARK